MKLITKHGTAEVNLFRAKYRDAVQTAIVALTPDGQPYMRLTSALDWEFVKLARILHIDLDEHVVIKNYSENEGVLQALIDAKVVSEPVLVYTQGHVEFPICKLLVELEDYNA